MRQWKRWCRVMALGSLAMGIMAGSAYAETAAGPAVEADLKQDLEASPPEAAEAAGTAGTEAEETPLVDQAEDGEAEGGEAEDGEAEHGEAEGRDTSSGAADVPMPEQIGQWITYLIASEKANAWKAYEAFIAKLYRDTTVLSRFGLEAPETAQRYGEEWILAQMELGKWEESRTAASASLQLLPAAMGAASGTDAAALPERDPAPLKLLQQAGMNVNAAQRGLTSAQLQHRAGLITSDELLAAHRGWLDARIAAADAKEAYYLAVRDVLAAGEADVRFTDFLKAIGQDDAALSREWLALLQQSGGAEEALPAATQPEGREFRAPDGQPAEALPYQAVTVPGMQVHTQLPPIRTGAGDIYVPLRPYAEALQYQVAWDAGKAALTGNGIHLVIAPGSTQAERNGEAIELPAVPYIQHDALLVPLAMFQRVLGKEVHWDEGMAQGYILP